MTVAALCIMCRFLARWRIQNSSIGWDDWTILMSFILLIPSTAILHISPSSSLGSTSSTTLIVRPSDLLRNGPRCLDGPVRRHYPNVQGMLHQTTRSMSFVNSRSPTVVLRRAISLPGHHRPHQDIHRLSIPPYLSERGIPTISTTLLDCHCRPCDLPLSLLHLLRSRVQASQLLLEHMGWRA